MKQYILPAALIIILLSSCVRSLYPITEDGKEMVFKKELLGHWKDKEGAMHFIDTLKAGDAEVYQIEIVDTNHLTKGFQIPAIFLHC
jgi:hypothetical protein